MIEKKCFYMAASSILTELAIEATKKAEVFINAQEMSSQGPAWEPTCLVYSHIRQCGRDTEDLGKKVSLCIANILNEQKLLERSRYETFSLFYVRMKRECCVFS